MKRNFLFVIISLWAISSFAYDFQIDQMNYTILTGNEVELAGTKGTKTNLNVPETVTNNSTTYTVVSIGSEAFQYKTGMNTVTLPRTIKQIGYNAFYGCTGLTAVYVPDIASWCNISFPYGSYEYRASPLYYAHNLYINNQLVENIVIPDTITTISTYAFFGCTSITSISIPSSVEYIGDEALANCGNLSSINVDEANLMYSSADGVLFNKDKTTLLQVPVGKQGAYVIPDGTTTVGRGAFSYCTDITDVTIPSSIKTFEQSAFEECSGLTAVRISDIKDWCSIDFNYDTASNPLHVAHDLYINNVLTRQITIPSEVTSIPTSAFYRCSLTSLILPATLTEIGAHAFSECAQLDTVFCYALTPPTLNGGFGVGLSPTAVLYVPYDALAAYKSEEGYSLYFSQIKGLSEVENITENTATLKWLPDTAVVRYDIDIFTGGTPFAHYEVNGDGQVTSSQRYAPSVYHIPMDTTTSSSDYFVISLGGLSAGTDYTYTINGTDAAKAPIYHEEGAFSTPSDTEGFEDAVADDPHKQTRKILQNGQLNILRGEKVYTLTGQEVR